MRELKQLKKRLSKKKEAISKIKSLYPHLKILDDDTLLEYLGLLSYDDLIEFSKELEYPNIDINYSNTSKRVCICSDSQGMPKVLYRYKADANRAKNFISQRENIKLKIYPCPTSNGWHLARV